MATDAKTARRNKILEKALAIFSKKTFQETTIAEISKAARVSEATVYEYFNSKEELLFAIPEKITRDAIEEFEKVLPYLTGAESRVRAIVQAYLTLYQNNPEYSSLVMLQLKTNRKFLQTRAYKLIQCIAGQLLDCINEGVAEGVFKKDIDPHLIRAMLLGTIEHLCIRWHLLDKPVNLIDYVDAIINLTFDGMRTRQPEKKLSIHLHLAPDGTLAGKTISPEVDHP